MEIRNNKLYTADGKLIAIFDYVDEAMLLSAMFDAAAKTSPIPHPTIRKPYLYFGKRVQLNKLKEEVDELLDELKHHTVSRQRVLEEAADVFLLLLQHLLEHRITMKQLVTQTARAANKIGAAIDLEKYDQATGKKK